MWQLLGSNYRVGEEGRGFNWSVLFHLIFFLNKFIYLFIFGCVGSSFLCKGFL